MMQDKVSVIVPIYNVEKYLDRCIKSIVDQTYNNLEIILVDDGSPDNCSDLCDSWKCKDERIVVIHKTNGGLSDARNAGLDISSGDYVMFIDSDDFISPCMVEYMLSCANEKKVDIVTCGRYIYKTSVLKKQNVNKKTRILSGEKAISFLFRGKYIEEAAWDKIYKREIFNKIRFPVGEINEDLPIMPYIFKKANKVMCTGIPLYYYCINETSITHTKYDSRKSVVRTHLEELENVFVAKNPQYKRDYNILKGRYSLGMLLYFVNDSKIIKDYYDDCLYFLNGLKSNLIPFLLSTDINLKRKIKSLIVIFKIEHKLKKLNR